MFSTQPTKCQGMEYFKLFITGKYIFVLRVTFPSVNLNIRVFISRHPNSELSSSAY
jgi:hypothetical protein